MAKTQDSRNAPDNGIMLPHGALDYTDLGSILGPSYRVENTPSVLLVDPVGSLVAAAFEHGVCLMSGS